MSVGLARQVYFAYKAGADLANATVTRGSTGGYTTRAGLYATKASNIARLHWRDIDGDGVHEIPRLLMEGARTNAYTAPEDFTDAAWTKDGATISANVAKAPDGVAASADKIVEDSGVNVAHQIYQALPALTDDTLQAPAIFVKRAERTWVRIWTRDKANAQRNSWYNLAAGAWGTTDAGHGLYAERFADDWYRLGVRFDAASGATTPLVVYALATADGVEVYTGDGSSGVYLWGAWFVADERFHSSYHSGARSADQIDFPASIPLHKSWTIYVKGGLQHGAITAPGSTLFLLNLRDSDGASRILFSRHASLAQLSVNYQSPAEATAAVSFSPPLADPFDLLIQHDATDHALSIALNGGSLIAGSAPTGQTKPFNQGITTVRLRNDGFWELEVLKIMAGLQGWTFARNAPTAVGV